MTVIPSHKFGCVYIDIKKNSIDYIMNSTKIPFLKFYFSTFSQIGDAGVTCICPNGFKGKNCQIPEDKDMNGNLIFETN